MGEKITVGAINRGLKKDVTAFNIDNDAFPTLLNAYQWRGRIKRKRGTSPLGRLKRFLGNTDGAGNITVTINPVPIPTGISFFVIGTDVFLDPGTTADPADQILITNSAGLVHTLNRVTGILTITGSIPNTAVFFFPSLPVMGLEDFLPSPDKVISYLGFDTRYAYSISNVFPYGIADVSFYKNPDANTDRPFYVPKATYTPLWWNGQDYQQFWTVNYQGALWATNGITVPFTTTNIGMQYAPSNTITFIARTATTITLQITNTPLVVGDFVFLNEWKASTDANAQTLNFQSGYVTTATPNTPGPGSTEVIITLPFANIAADIFTPGIVQYLTNRSDTTKDNIRWYDGDPTNGSATAPVLNGTKGWVNFSPPLSQFSFSIADLPAAQYYLVGARMIIPFKDRLLFIGPVVQTSAAGSQRYLQDVVIYSQNGTPYYTASFTGDPALATTKFNPILVPDNQTATPTAYWEDQTGFGGFIAAGVSQPIITASPNEDVLIMGFGDNLQTRFAYTGNDIVPFNFFLVNAEYPSGSTFSIVNMDRGVITKGDRGFVITGQTQCQRIDLDIPDEVFETRLLDNGSERTCAQRDFINEWAYFTYPVEVVNYKFPTQTLQYNYRDQTWAIFRETYTTYGTFRKRTGFTWATVGTIFPTWSSWNEPWNSGSSTLLQPLIMAGNQQGFIIIRDDGTDEANSLSIQNIIGSTVTCPNHCLSNGDFIMISGALGTVGTEVNNKIFSVSIAQTNSFVLNPVINAGTYLGGGLIKRMYRPFIQTKQFPVAWAMARKVRIGVQQYLLTTTERSQITLLIFLSQNDESPYNSGTLVPDIDSDNNSLIYSTVLYTCPESTNLGLTPANTNLQMPTAAAQQQIWHRVNTSLIGDSVQLGFTLSDAQMRALDDDGKPISQFSEIELHGIILDVSPSQVLA
jgi:hypothetical protein